MPYEFIGWNIFVSCSPHWAYFLIVSDLRSLSGLLSQITFGMPRMSILGNLARSSHTIFDINTSIKTFWPQAVTIVTTALEFRICTKLLWYL